MPTGYRLTEFGNELCPIAQRVEDAVAAVRTCARLYWAVEVASVPVPVGSSGGGLSVAERRGSEWLNIYLPLPPYSPELNPVERLWLYLKERFLSLRLHNDYTAIVAAASKAWKRLCKHTGRLASLTAYPWIMRVKP